MTAFDALLCEIRGCRLCARELPLGPRPILQGSPRSRILLAGQAPGSKAHRSGIAFDDASGDRLREWLGVDAERFYDPELFAILPLGFCYPGRGRSGDLPPRAECAPAWRERLLLQLAGVELTLLLGKYAQLYHLGAAAASVTDNVRRWRDFWPGVIPLPHPSPRNNRWLRQNPWFESELLPALRDRIEKLTNG